MLIKEARNDSPENCSADVVPMLCRVVPLHRGPGRSYSPPQITSSCSGNSIYVISFLICRPGTAKKARKSILAALPTMEHYLAESNVLLAVKLLSVGGSEARVKRSSSQSTTSRQRGKNAVDFVKNKRRCRSWAQEDNDSYHFYRLD